MMPRTQACSRLLTLKTRRLKKIHEYQGKQILREFGVPVPRGIPAFTVEEAAKAAPGAGRGLVWAVMRDPRPVAAARAAAPTAKSIRANQQPMAMLGMN